MLQQLIVESVRLSAAKAMHDPVGLQQYFQARMSECKILTQRDQPPADMWPGILVGSLLASLALSSFFGILQARSGAAACRYLCFSLYTLKPRVGARCGSVDCDHRQISHTQHKSNVS